MNDISYSLNIDVTSQLLSYDVYVASKNDTNIRYLNIALFENGNAVPLSENASATASFVTNNVLIAEDIACTIAGNIITVPLTDLQQHGNLDIQVTVTDGSKILATPYPIQVKVTPNIAETAQIDENSMGSYAEVVQEIATARDGYNNLDERLDSMESESAATYERLTNKSQTINPTQQSDDNVKYPSVKAARDYTDSRVANLRNDVNNAVDSLDSAKADAATTYSKTDTDRNIAQAAARKESLSNKVQSINANTSADDNDNYPSVYAARSYTNGKFTNLKNYVDGEVRTLNSAKADKTDVYTKTQVYTQSEANGRFEVKSNKVTEITAESAADSNKYPSATAVKNYVDGEVRTLNSAKADKTDVYTKEASDRRFEANANKVITIDPQQQGSDNVSYPSVTAVRNYIALTDRDLTAYVDGELDSLDDSIQEELSGKEDKTNKVTEITGGSTANQYPTVAAVKNYTDSKVEESEQYFPDMAETDITSEVTFVLGKFVKNDGTIGSHEDFKRTNFIDISGYKKLKIHTAYGYQAVMVAFYSGQTFASFINFYGESSSSIVEPAGDTEVNIPEGASYAIISYFINAVNSFKVIGVYEQEVTIKNKLRQIVESQSSYEITDNKVGEITSQALSSDNVKYPSVTAARNYTNSKYNDLKNYVDGELDTRDERIDTISFYHYDSVDVNYTINENQYCNSSGTILTSDYYNCTDDFDIKDFSKLVITSKYGGSQAGLIAFFDNEDNIVGYINDQQTLADVTKEIDLSSYKSDGAVNAIVNCARSASEFKISGVRDVTIENKLKQVSDKADCITDLTGKKIYVGGDSIMYGHGSGGYAIGEYLSKKYSMKLKKGAVTGATLSTSFNNSICTRMCALEGAEEELKLVGDFDVIIFDGGVNDKSRGYELGALTNNFEDNFDTAKVIGALEKICRRLVLDYPSAKKLFIISNEMTTSSYSTNKPQIEYMEALIPVLNKWGIPYVNMLNTSIKAFNDEYNREFFFEEDRLHPNLSGYEAFYFDKVEKALLFGSTDLTTAEDGYSPTATVTQTQNGATVSITDKNGTTTANISNGVNGSDYILTAQDKSDIADLVLAELPTTQGVQYGNTNN